MADYIMHTVQPGETLWSIAHKYNVTVDELVKFNNLPYPDQIFVGQVIDVPLKTPNNFPPTS